MPQYHTPAIEQKPIRSAAYLHYRELVTMELIRAGMDDDAEAYRNCSDPALSFFVNHTGNLPDGAMGVTACSADSKHPAKAVLPTCHKRYCCDCAAQQSARLLARYVDFMKGLVRDDDPVYKLRHIVLTTPIALTDLSCRKDMLYLYNQIRDAFWDELLGVGWRDNCGVLIASDFGEDGLKLHFHILAYTPFIDKDAITRAWLKVTGGLCEINWIRLVTESGDGCHDVDSAVAEILKYATKLWKVLKNGEVVYLDPKLIPVLASVLRGTRRIRSYGVFNGFAVEKRAHVCEVCAAPQIRLNRLDWEIYVKTGWLPVEFATQRRRALLDLKTGNNFFGGGGVKKPPPVYQRLYLPTFDPLIDNKLENMLRDRGTKC